MIRACSRAVRRILRVITQLVSLDLCDKAIFPCRDHPLRVSPFATTRKRIYSLENSGWRKVVSVRSQCSRGGEARPGLAESQRGPIDRVPARAPAGRPGTVLVRLATLTAPADARPTQCWLYHTECDANWCSQSTTAADAATDPMLKNMLTFPKFAIYQLNLYLSLLLHFGILA